MVLGGIYQRLQVAHMKLCASRAFWLVAYPGQGHEMLFDAHTRSFVALGGVARRGIYDNMRTAVDKVKKGKGRVVNARFANLCAHYPALLEKIGLHRYPSKKFERTPPFRLERQNDGLAVLPASKPTGSV